MRVNEALLLGHGVVRTHDFPSLRSSWGPHISAGRLIRALPGVLMDAGLAADPVAWMRAVHRWDHNAVLAGAAASFLTFDAEADLDEILVCARTRLADRGPIRFLRHALDPDLATWVRGVRVTTPAATALTAGLRGDYATATNALRLGVASQESLRDASERLTVRPREPLVHVLHNLSANPWSVAEVDAHRLFRAAGIRGWVGNYEVVVDGHAFAIDIALPESRIAFEINSFEFHSRREDMMRDSSRANLLASAGWRQYVLLPTQVSNQPRETMEFVRQVVWARHRGASNVSCTGNRGTR